MKLPSLPYLADAFAGALRRFPLVMITAVVGVISAMLLIEDAVDNHPETYLIKSLMTMALGLPLFLAASILAEKWHWLGWRKWLPSAVAAILLALFYLTLHFTENEPSQAIVMRFLGLNLCAHLLVAYLPYSDNSPVEDFWEYNKRLFGNFVVGGFYSGVIFAGLSIAILAVNELFDLDIDGKIYGHLFVLVAGLFNTAFFLANFPSRFHFHPDAFHPVEPTVSTAEAPRKIHNSYTVAIKNLSKFILVPIVAIYFLILYAYSVRILASWELPKGWVSSLVLGFSIAGIFTYLLNYLLVNFDDSRIVSNYRRWFFYVLLPMVVLLFVGIGRRISDYGVTEERFVVATAGVWLLIISLYFILSKKDNIKFIPISLSLFALLSVLGPFNAFRISGKSQAGRLKTLLEKNAMLVDGKAAPPKDTVSAADAEGIRSILFYMRDFEHFHRVGSWFGLPVSQKNPSWSSVDSLLQSLKVGYGGAATTNRCGYFFPPDGSIAVQGYDELWKINAYEGFILADTFSGLAISPDKSGFDFYLEGKTADHFDIQPYLKNISAFPCYATGLDKMNAQFEVSGNMYHARFVAEDINFDKGEGMKLFSWSGFVLLRKK
jgi:hypothetical protein